ncbi:complement regulator-acquiring protein [Borreliella valaisiana]|uniref:complement regulator-acquiring protein n=1 Tax=Borreliella valaisiana TaxID=62088 RepID=UPI001AEEDCAB|nr:complement regulator-acquiring protein [Borreliella valaisiana]WLN25748.1 complement regulator-acquiring protein [Borreliella valaisiana]
MKYNIIVGIFVFLFLTACNPDFNTNQKDANHHSNKKRLKSNKKGLTPKTEITQNQEVTPNQEVNPNQRAKNKLLDDLRNLIEKANTDRKKYEKKSVEEPSNQYGMEVFKTLFWIDSPKESAADNTARSKNYRKLTYCALNDIDINKLKEISEIIILSKQHGGLLNAIRDFGSILDEMIFCLYPKKDTLDKLEISDLEKLKNSFEKLLSIKTIFSEDINQILLDYQNNENLIKTDTTKLKSHATTLLNQILEKIKEARELRSEILFLLIKNLEDIY